MFSCYYINDDYYTEPEKWKQIVKKNNNILLSEVALVC